MDKPLTVIVSDLHVGDGADGGGDDHVFDQEQFATYVDELAGSPEGVVGDIELYINGDFLEFAQTLQTAYGSPDLDYWCSELESLAKLDAIIAGHPSIFDALGRFVSKGNQLTIAAGNHDVDLYWKAVRDRICARVGDGVLFDVGSAWYTRYGGRLQIAHGHQDDRANRFERWDDPIRILGGGADRLEMCPGTKFMVQMVNPMEAKYPFADNLQPVTKLASVLMREDKGGLALAAWTFTKFVARSPITAGLHEGKIDERIVQRFRTDDQFVEEVARLLTTLGRATTVADIRAKTSTANEAARFMFGILGVVPFEQWEQVFLGGGGHSLSAGGDGKTLGIILRAAQIDNRQAFRDVALERLGTFDKAEIVVMGHTHLPDELSWNGKRYFNPGCWTRYLEVKDEATVTMEQLKDEKRFPYSLQSVIVRLGDDGKLTGKMHIVGQQPGVKP